jgi:hypothetical protein
MAMGNHDGEGYLTGKDDNRQKAIAEIFEKGKYSLFRRGPDNVTGQGNYGVNITDTSGNVLYSLIFLDTGKDYLRKDQIDWYEWYVKGVSKAQYGTYATPSNVVKSLVFIHIPLPEINDVKNILMSGTLAEQDRAKDAFRETPTPPNKNTGMFQRAKDLQSTSHIFFGHDHNNMICYNYQGINLVYCLKTGANAIYDKTRVGTTLITLQDDTMNPGKAKVAPDIEPTGFKIRP